MTSKPTPEAGQDGERIWRRRDITCDCLRVAPDHITIILMKNGVHLLEGCFGDDEEAAQFAADMLRHYDV